MYIDKLNEIISRVVLIVDEDKDLLELSYKRNFFDKVMRKDMSYEEYDERVSKVCEIVYKHFYKLYSYDNRYSNNLINELCDEITNSYNFRCSLDIDDCVRVYPIEISDEKVKQLYLEELKEVIKELVIENKKIDEVIDELKQKYKDKNSRYKDYLLKKEMRPYYGDMYFMLQRVLYIEKCISRLHLNEVSFSKLIKEMEDLCVKYNITRSHSVVEADLYNVDEFKGDYDKFSSYYKKVLEIEKLLSEVVVDKWGKFLSDPSNHNDSSFAYVIHTFSDGLVNPSDMRKACCTLATDKLLTIPYGNCGLIYEFDKDALEVMSVEDAGSWSINKFEFIDRCLPKGWQLVNPDKEDVFYEYPKISKLILPEYLEKEVIINNELANGEILNYDNGVLYSEIYLNEKARAVGVFYSDAVKNIEEIKMYADKYNLPLVHLSLKKLREQQGLDVKKIDDESNLKK